MKGVILAGGTGSRLHPLTKITNKHLLPVYDKPMIYYAIEALVKADIRDILIVTGGNHAGEFLKLLGNGREFGLQHINYSYQEGAGGIAEALGLAEHFAMGEKVTVFLGDNIIEGNIVGPVHAFREQEHGAKILLKEVENPREYGVAELSGNRIVSIEEKPQAPKSNLAVIGIYMYGNEVFDIVKTLKPSHRGELEITDVNNHYIREETMTYEVLNGWWGDAGESIEALMKVGNLVAETGANKLTL
ncbi:MAG: NTP transferase domain-containing protein [Armatimonadetes bacterium]|nr:NTP transferase domain-containing protein [Armatimonadota bacterium]